MLAEKCNIRNFRIEQRIKLLSDGLNDRSRLHMSGILCVYTVCSKSWPQMRRKLIVSMLVSCPYLRS